MQESEFTEDDVDQYVDGYARFGINVVNNKTKLAKKVYFWILISTLFFQISIFFLHQQSQLKAQLDSFFEQYWYTPPILIVVLLILIILVKDPKKLCWLPTVFLQLLTISTNTFFFAYLLEKLVKNIANAYIIFLVH